MSLFGSSNNALEIVISARDEASAQLATLKGNIEKMQPTFQKMAVIGSAAFVGIGLAIKETVDAASESAKVQAQLAAVLKSTGKAAGLSANDINEQAKALQNLTTYEDEAIGSTANLLLTFTNIKGAVFQNALPAILDMSTAMGTDLQSSAIQVGKALNDPVQGINALARVGVTFSDKQKEVIKTLAETGHVAEAQKLILAELAKEFGGSASAQAQTFAGKMLQLKNQINDVQETIGNAFIPMLESMVVKVKPIVEQVGKWIEKNPELVKNLLLAGLAVSGFVAIVGLLGIALIPLTAGLTFLLSPLGLITITVAALIIGFIAFKDRLIELLAFVDEKTGIVTLFQWAWNQIATTISDVLMPSLQALWDQLQPLMPVLEIMAKIIGVVLLGAVYGIVLAVTGWIQILSALVAMGAEVARTVTEYFTKPILDFIDTVKSAIDWVAKLISKMAGVGGGVAKSIGKTVGKILGFEHGGTVPGPEGKAVPIIAHGGETVIPARQSQSGGGGSTFVINISNPNVRSQADVALLRQQMEEALRGVMRDHKLATT